MIPGDIGTALARVLRAAVRHGELPPAVAAMSAAGTWRPAPALAGGGPGRYATSLPFALARLTGQDAAGLAGSLAPRLAAAAGIGGVAVTGGGYLTVTVTDAALARLAVRVVAAGPGCAASDALRGTRLADPGRADLAAAASWRQARDWLAAEITARLAARSGATLQTTTIAKRPPSPHPAVPDRSPVTAAMDLAGPDAVRYALARTPSGQAGEMAGRIRAEQVPGNPFFAVAFAHADAASTLRWAADLGIRRGGPRSLRPGELTHPRQRELLTAISWLPERVAGAARRGRPDELTGYLEHLAGAWLCCRETCPALPFGGCSAARDPAGRTARLWLADAARTALAAGLELIGVAARRRL